MNVVKSATENLKKAVGKAPTKERKKYAENIGQIASHFVLLKSPRITPQATQKLAECLRGPLLPMYSAFPLVTLQLAAALFHKIYHSKVLNSIGMQQEEQQLRWEIVLNSLLSGILDFLDSNDSNLVKNAIGTALYSTLCETCFSLSAPMMGVDLRCNAYNLLSDSAAGHTGNQLKLRDKDILGCERLGAMIWRTKDYLALECMLNLFARLLPSTKKAGGRAQRAAFIRSVFVSSPPPEVGDVGHRVVDILENVASQDWEDTAIKIVDTLAQSNLTFPQPFAITNFTAYGNAQPIDCLYADGKGFLANVLRGEDQYESLEARYSTIAKIQFSDAAFEKQQCTIELATPPTIGKDPVTTQLPMSTTPSLVFLLANKDLQCFQRVLRARKLDKCMKPPVPPKLSLAKSGTLLEFDAQGQPVEDMCREQRIEAVAEFYGTQHSSDEMCSPGSSDKKLTGEATEGSRKSHVKNESKDLANTTYVRPSPVAQQSTSHEHDKRTTIDRVKRSSKSRTPVTAIIFHEKPADPSVLKRTGTEQIREEIFGLSDEELSEISEADSLPIAISETLARPSAACFKAAEGPGDAAARRKQSTGRQILDSDDDADEAAKTKPLRTCSRPKATKKAVLADVDTSEDEIEDIISSDHLPIDTIVEVSEPPREILRTPPRRFVSAATVHSAAKIPEVSLSDPMGTAASIQNNTLTAGTIAALSALVASVSATTEPGHADSQPLSRPIDTLSTVSADLVLPVTLPETTRKPPSKASQRSELVKLAGKLATLPSSSPVPVIQAERKSIKANLRKKDQKIVADAAHVKASKRKRSSQDEPNGPTPSVKSRIEDRPTASKRAKKNETQAAALAPSVNTGEDHVLRPRTAAARPAKTYRAKKERLSSPASATRSSVFVDYDALPKSAPSSSTGKTPSSPLARGTNKKGVIYMKSTAPAADNAPPVRRTRAAARKDKENTTVAEIPAATEAKKPEARKLRAKQNASKTTQNALPTPDNTTLEEDTSGVRDDSSIYRPNKNVKLKTAAPAHGTAVVSDDKWASLADARSKPKTQNSNKAPWEVVASSSLAHEPAIEMAPFPELPDHLDVKTSSSDVGPVTATALDDPFTMPADDIPQDNVPVNIDSPDKGLKAESILKNKGLLAASAQSYAEIVVEPAQIVEKPVEVKPTIESASVSPYRSSLDSKARPEPIQDAIDLTIDSPSKSRKSTASITSPAASPHRSLVKSLNNSVDEITHSTPYVKIKKVQRAVTFDPVVQERHASLVSATSTDDEPFTVADYSISPMHLPIPEPVAAVKRGPPKPPRKIIPHKLRPQHDRSEKASASRATNRRMGGDSPGVDDIVEVLNEIQEAILDRITKKLEGVRHEVRIGRDALAAEAAADLLDMRAESVEKFNGLIDLEVEYAKFGRTVTHRFEDMVNVNKEICDGLKQAIQDHDRYTLSKKMPCSLCPVLPASMQKFLR